MDHVKWMKNELQKDSQPLFTACVWWVWRARNSHCIAKEITPSWKLQIAIQNLHETIKVCFHGADINEHSHQWVRWHSSRQQATILNVDGSSLGNPGKAGFGGIIRNSDGA